MYFVELFKYFEMCPEQVQFYSNDIHMFALDVLKRLLRTFGSRN
jgi:hypothetical protein